MTEPLKPVVTVPSILEDMAQTYRVRNKAYGANYLMIAPMIKVLFPDGVPSALVATHRWHLFELKLVKIARFAVSGLTHVDSIHDDAVYSAMIEELLTNKQEEDL